MEMLSRYCSDAGYRQMCCKSCSKRNSSMDNSSWNLTTESMMSLTTSSSLDSSYIVSDIISTRPPTVTAPSTSKSNMDFVYVDYNDYSEDLSYEGPSSSSETSVIRPTETISTATTTRTQRKTALPHLFKKKTPMMHVVTSPTVTQSQTPEPIRTQFLTTMAPDVKDITPPSEGDSPSSLFLLSKKNNNSVAEVQYRIVGLESEATREHHNHFVPRLRTRNKEILQLLKKKQLQDLLSLVNRTGVIRTDKKHDTGGFS